MRARRNFFEAKDTSSSSTKAWCVGGHKGRPTGSGVLGRLIPARLAEAPEKYRSSVEIHSVQRWSRKRPLVAERSVSPQPPHWTDGGIVSAPDVEPDARPDDRQTNSFKNGTDRPRRRQLVRESQERPARSGDSGTGVARRLHRLRCGGPQQVMQLGLLPPVDVTSAPHSMARTYAGVSDRSRFRNLAWLHGR